MDDRMAALITQIIWNSFVIAPVNADMRNSK